MLRHSLQTSRLSISGRTCTALAGHLQRNKRRICEHLKAPSDQWQQTQGILRSNLRTRLCARDSRDGQADSDDDMQEPEIFGPADDVNELSVADMQSAGGPMGAEGEEAVEAEDDEKDEGEPLRAGPGDLVYVHFDIYDETGEMLIDSSRSVGEPMTFEVGAGEIVGNKIFEVFDTAVRGMTKGDITELQAQGSDWTPELLFQVPLDHPEVQRLQGRYKNQGGLQKFMVVELVNGHMAIVSDMTDEGVELDANAMMAGRSMTIRLELMGIERAGTYIRGREDFTPEEIMAAMPPPGSAE